MFQPLFDPHRGRKTLAPWEAAFKEELESRNKTDRLLTALSIRNRLPIRNEIARRSLSGSGVEIGAQHVPTKVAPKKTSMEYVDRLTADDLATQFGLPRESLVDVTHLIDGGSLAVYPDGSKDFLIANHVLEHFDDPVAALIEWLRILAPGGRLFITLPNFRNNMFDFRRRPPTKAHFQRDFRDAVYRQANNRLHYADIVQSLYQFEETDPLILATADLWERNQERHHYHVYDEQAIRDVLTLVSTGSNVSLKIINSFILTQGFEFLLVIEKGSGSASLEWPDPIKSRCRSLFLLSKLAISDVLKFYSRGADTRFIDGKTDEKPKPV
jgi:SAM-dependent methyltransferase